MCIDIFIFICNALSPLSSLWASYTLKAAVGGGERRRGEGRGREALVLSPTADSSRLGMQSCLDACLPACHTRSPALGGSPGLVRVLQDIHLVMRQ